MRTEQRFLVNRCQTGACCATTPRQFFALPSLLLCVWRLPLL